jgi:precorrin-6A/cobalt-precorrin-6A reductase
MRVKRVLILGGTKVARAAADALVSRGFSVMTSLAGVTSAPQLPKGEIRIGGFGGAAGLAAFLRGQKFDLVIDATHAFAAQMSGHAAQACAETDTPLLRLEEPAWLAQAGDDWLPVASVAEAVVSVPRAARVAVTVGRKEIAGFFARSDISGIARMIEPPAVQVPAAWQLLLERPPFSLASEVDLLRAGQVQVLVSKNAGGVRAAKLDAAAALGLRVIMVARPVQPPAATVASVAELLGRGELQG